MRLSLRPLTDVQNVNSYEVVPGEITWTEGDVLTFYFQLCDISLDTSAQGYSPPGRRYVPAAGSTLTVILENVDDDKKITRTATQPFATDGSIWSISILSSDKTKGSPQLKFNLVEPGSVLTSGILRNAVRVWPKDNLE
jgi:hypothetical protein